MTEFSAPAVALALGPYQEYANPELSTPIPRWEEVDPMVRGVWEMAKILRERQIVNTDHQWLEEFTEKIVATERRASGSEPWVVSASDLKQYFHLDGFAGLTYGYADVQRFIESKGSYVHVDWMAGPAAVESASSDMDAALDMGISIGLGPHATDDLKSRNIHHIEGSILDPSRQARMIELLDDREIDLFTARPKGGKLLLPLSPSASAANYYYRLTNSIYQRLSSDGFMFFELPVNYTWLRVVRTWTNQLIDQGVDADSTLGAMVIRKGEVEKLPPIRDDPILYTDDPSVNARCIVSPNGERLPKLETATMLGLWSLLTANPEA